MNSVVSKDGTSIAFEKVGQGWPIIMVVGAFNDHTTAEPLAQLLAPQFTAYTYDRRGRGASGDTQPYSVDREIEDIGALIAEAGGAAAVFGYSSGAVLSLRAAAMGLPITQLAVYEPPFLVDDTRPRLPADFAAHIAKLVAAGQRGDAVEFFQTQGVGIPPEMVAKFRKAPFWPALEAIAHTLVYDTTITGDLSVPVEMLASVAVPTLAIDGGASPAWMRNGVKAAANALPNGQQRTLDGQVHDIVPSVLAPVLRDFFAGQKI